MQVLLEHADAPQIRKEDQRHAGHLLLKKSVKYDFVGIVKCLLHFSDFHGVPSNTLLCTTLCKDGTTARKPREEIFRMLLQKSRSNVACKDSAGRTVLSYIAEAGRYEMLQILLDETSASDRKTLANDKGDSAGRSPLWWAAAGSLRGGRYDEIVEALCREAEAAVQLDSIGPEGESAIAMAAVKGHYQRVQILAATRPTLVDVPDECGRTPLSLAAETQGGTKVAEILLSTGKVNVDSTSDIGYTPLQYAVSRGDAPLARMLILRGGADIRKFLTVDADRNLQLITKRPAQWPEQRVFEALRDRVKGMPTQY